MELNGYTNSLVKFKNYEQVVNNLKHVHIKLKNIIMYFGMVILSFHPNNIIMAHQLLATRKQKPRESVDQ